MNDEDWLAAEEGAELLREGRILDALDVLSRLVVASPDNAYGHHFLGAAFFEDQDYPRALKCYVRALELEPGYLGALVGAGHALRHLGRLDEAIRCGRQLLERAPDDADAHHLLGLVHFQRGDTAEARRHLIAFLDSRPEIETRLEVQGMLQVLEGQVSPFPGRDPEVEDP